MTQEFFLRFFERDWLARADQQRGRFRTFLLTILTRFLADQGNHRAPRQAVFDNQVETKFIEFLRAELADQVASPSELDQEIRDFRELLGN